MSEWRKDRFSIEQRKKLLLAYRLRKKPLGRSDLQELLEETNKGVDLICRGEYVAPSTAEIEEPVVRIAWTIFKLKVVRRLLRPLLKLHIWYEMRSRK